MAKSQSHLNNQPSPPGLRHIDFALRLQQLIENIQNILSILMERLELIKHYLQILPWIVLANYNRGDLCQ